MNISSGFLLLHVKDGRHELFDHFKRGGNPLWPCAEDLRVPVEIRGYVDGVCGNDDGVSIEYGVVVTDVQAEAPIAVSADSAMLDVKEGRYALLRHFRRNGHRSPSYDENRRVEVKIRGYIDCMAGFDHRASMGYSVIVTDVQALAPHLLRSGCLDGRPVRAPDR